jgi:hypothetical protein
MKTINRLSAGIATAALLAACAGTPVSLGTRAAGPIPTGEARTITAEACGFQLLLFIPISINSRAERAYQALEAEAGGDFITNVQVKERWTYGFVGTQYCTVLQAKAVRPKSS